MASGLPVVKQTAWLSIFPQIIIIGIIFFVCSIFSPENFYIFGFSIYILLLYALRTLIPSHHRKGVKLYKQKRYEEAIPFFKESYNFFRKNMWLDKYRFITMLSSSKITYIEMAMLNEAFCLAQLGRKTEAAEKYEDILKTYPDSEMALSALKLLR